MDDKSSEPSSPSPDEVAAILVRLSLVEARMEKLKDRFDTFLEVNELWDGS